MYMYLSSCPCKWFIFKIYWFIHVLHMNCITQIYTCNSFRNTVYSLECFTYVSNCMSCFFINLIQNFFWYCSIFSAHLENWILHMLFSFFIGENSYKGFSCMKHKKTWINCILLTSRYCKNHWCNNRIYIYAFPH